jgi:membrane fusion protein (multidrug efflux system)
MRVGQPVEIDVDAYPGCQAEGRVESLSAATGARFALLPPDNATGNFTKVVQRVPVRIEITKGCGVGRPLRQGLSVTTHVRTAAGK